MCFVVILNLLRRGDELPPGVVLTDGDSMFSIRGLRDSFKLFNKFRECFGGHTLLFNF